MHVLSTKYLSGQTQTILDATQNVSGWVKLIVKGKAGDTITVRHAEVLENDGSLHTASLRTAKATDTYVLGENGILTLEPRSTFHGFRYAEVTTQASLLAASAIAIASAIRPRSDFISSHSALNRLHENVIWSQLDNFVSIPTDCPQRDERLGWTGDAQAFAATANTLFDTESFWMSWLRDVEISQDRSGAVASVVPNIIRPDDMRMGNFLVNDMGRAGWADAATIVPWATYMSTGSSEVLTQQIDSMRRWVNHLHARAGSDILLPDEPFQYGDWLDPDAPVDQPWAAKVTPRFVANCFYVHSARLLARTERLLGNYTQADHYKDIAEQVSTLVWERWRTEAHDTQTGAAMCLEFGIVPNAERETLAAALAANVRRENGRIATGFLGTPLILFALSRNGYTAEAYMMLLRRDHPSWLYQVDRGATTVWERWDAIRADGSIHRGDMAGDQGDTMISFNHYAYGAVIDWVYQNIAGMSAIEAGYRRTRIAPRPASILTSARSKLQTPFGTMSTAWEANDSLFEMVLDVPFGITACLDLPTTPASHVEINGEPYRDELGYGSYLITVTTPAIVSVDGPAS